MPGIFTATFAKISGREDLKYFFFRYNLFEFGSHFIQDLTSLLILFIDHFSHSIKNTHYP